MHKYLAAITSVINSTRVEMLVDLGFGIMVKREFRLSGLSSPITRTDHEEIKARNFLNGMLKRLDYQVVFQSVKLERGEYVVELFSLANVSINRRLVEAGLVDEHNDI